MVQISNLSYFVLVLLCFSIHECNARSLGVKPDKRSHFSIKNGDKLNLAWVSIQSDEKSSVPTTFKTSTKKRVIVPGVTQTDQSVSWRMPQKKRAQKDPGFNLDYLPPKTHPPVHN